MSVRYEVERIVVFARERICDEVATMVLSTAIANAKANNAMTTIAQPLLLTLEETPISYRLFSI